MSSLYSLAPGVCFLFKKKKGKWLPSSKTNLKEFHSKVFLQRQIWQKFNEIFTAN